VDPEAVARAAVEKVADLAVVVPAVRAVEAPVAADKEAVVAARVAAAVKVVPAVEDLAADKVAEVVVGRAVEVVGRAAAPVVDKVAAEAARAEAVAEEQAVQAAVALVVVAVQAAALEAVDPLEALAPALPAVVAEEDAAVEPNRRQARRYRLAVTLLELILALSLSILVLMSISMAINLYFRMLDVRRTNVEETRVASSVLKHIAADLRCTVQYTPPDLSGLEELTASLTSSATGAAASAIGGQLQAAAGGGSSGGGSSGSGGGGSSGGGGTSGGAPSSGGGGSSAPSGKTSGTGTSSNLQPNTGTSSQSKTTGQTSGTLTSTKTGSTSLPGSAPPAGFGATQIPSGTGASTASGGSSSGSQQSDPNATTTETTSTTPTLIGFFGSSTELRFDVSRLPRVDQFQATIGESGDENDVQIPSDIKTVVYFLQDDSDGMAVTTPELGGKVAFAQPSTSGRGRGLIRSEQDRAVLALAESGGDELMKYSGAHLLADEVIGLQFEYFDGASWVTDWDSSTMNGLPRAVKITLTLQPTYAMNEKGLSMQSSTSQAPEQNFQLVVNLPRAELIAKPAAAESTEGTDASTSATTGTAAQGGTTP
jgi:hypothetical protein